MGIFFTLFYNALEVNISIMSVGTNVDITFNEVKNDSIYKMCIEFNKETEMFVAVIKTSDK